MWLNFSESKIHKYLQIFSPVKENKEEKGQEKDEEGNPSEIGLGGK